MQGSIIAVLGEGLGPNVSTAISASGFPIQTELAGVSIQVTVAGNTVQALPLYVSQRQIGALLPSAIPTGSGTLTVTFNGQTSEPAPVSVVKRNFGIFTVNRAGTGPALLQNAGPDRALNSVLNSAKPGETVTLYGTGLGPVSGEEEKRAQPGDLGIPVTVYVGNESAEVLYAGRAGEECCGIDTERVQHSRWNRSDRVQSPGRCGRLLCSGGRCRGRL